MKTRFLLPLFLAAAPAAAAQDAEALAALAHAAPERLRELARALHRAKGE